MALQASAPQNSEVSQPESWGACREEVKEALPLLVPGRESRVEGENEGPLRLRWLKPGLALAGTCCALVLASIVLFSLADGRSNSMPETLEKTSLGKRSMHTRFLEADQCATYDHMDFLDLVHNNLANKGPDEGDEGMVYLARDVLTETRVYVHINAMSDYTPYDANTNGWEGPYGCINLQPGSSVTLRIRLSKDRAGQEPLHLRELPWTFVDLDGAVGHTAMEFLTAGGFSHSLTEDTAELFEKKTKDGQTTFTATARGIGADNPKEPYSLSQMQKDRSVVLFYENIHEFNLTIGASEGDEPRYMTFLATPVLLCANTKDIMTQSAPEHSTAPKLPKLVTHLTQLAIKPVTKHDTFKRWFVEEGDDLKPGSWIALTRNPTNGRMDVIMSKVRGTVAKIHKILKGDIITDRVESGVMAVIQKTEKLPPLHYNPDFETPVRTDVPGYIFGKWLVKVGDTVKKGDTLATAFTPENVEEDIMAGCDGKIKALQPLPPQEAIDVLVHDQMVAIITRQEAIITTTATATTTTSLTPTSTTRTTSTSTSTGTSSTSTSTKSTTTTQRGNLWR